MLETARREAVNEFQASGSGLWLGFLRFDVEPPNDLIRRDWQGVARHYACSSREAKHVSEDMLKRDGATPILPVLIFVFLAAVFFDKHLQNYRVTV